MTPVVETEQPVSGSLSAYGEARSTVKGSPLTPDELKIVWQLRRVLHALEPQQALEVLMERMKGTKSNAEFLLQVQKTTVSS